MFQHAYQGISLAVLHYHPLKIIRIPKEKKASLNFCKIFGIFLRYRSIDHPTERNQIISKGAVYVNHGYDALDTVGKTLILFDFDGERQGCTLIGSEIYFLNSLGPYPGYSGLFNQVSGSVTLRNMFVVRCHIYITSYNFFDEKGGSKISKTFYDTFDRRGV